MQIAFMPDTHFGSYDQPTLPSGPDVADAMDHCLAEAEIAERVGFDGIWVPERHQRPETWWPNTVTLLAALAARTSRTQLACTVMQPTFHHPVHLAEQLANIDCLSRGRLTFGAGVGYHEDYFRHFGVRFEKRGRRFEETLEVIEACWTRDKVDYHGEFFDYDGVRMTPKPYQTPRPPIWIGAFAEQARERAFRWDGWVTWLSPAVPDLREQVDAMREEADKRGKKGWQIALGVEGWLSDDPDIRQKHGHRWVREWGFYADKALSPDMKSGSVAGGIEDRYLCLGNAQKWLDHLGKIKEELKPDWLGIRTRTPVNPGQYYPSRSESLEVVERFGEILAAAR